MRAEEGHELLAGRRGEAKALRHVRGARPVQALSTFMRGGSPVQVVVDRGKVVVARSGAHRAGGWKIRFGDFLLSGVALTGLEAGRSVSDL